MPPSPPPGFAASSDGPAVCSWSLRPRGPEDLAEAVRSCGLSAVQLALDPVRTGAWDEHATARVLRSAGIAITSGMMAMEGEDYSTLESISRTGGVRPDATWPANRAAAHANADLARRLGLRLVTFHAGAIPHDRADADRARIIGRLRDVAGAFATRGVRVALETGQEHASTMIDLLAELNRGAAAPPAGVNFDPANMILYGTGDPVSALRRLAPHVVQSHVKDARPAVEPGAWGTEVPAGSGAVDWPGFFGSLPPATPLVIEREGGDRRVDDVLTAAALVRRHAAAR